MKPILFNGEMVRAILDGRKTQTRRIVKGLDDIPTPYGVEYSPDDDGSLQLFDFLYGYITESKCLDCFKTIKAPYKPGDTLYVRETWAKIRDGYLDIPDEYAYKADNRWSVPRWRPSIHMPREAARLFLKVEDVRASRLQDMNENDFKAEGVLPAPWRLDCIGLYAEAFSDLWDSTIKPMDKHRYGWAANPWVWDIRFRRITRDEAML